MNKKYIKTKFILVSVCIVLLGLVCMRIGTINLTFKEILEGLIKGNNSQVEIIKAVRLPRIFVSVLTGAMLATSGVLLQAVMKNPLADPGIVGISAGANFMNSLVLTFVPTLFFSAPIFGLIGGLIACALVYAFAFQKGFQPKRIILAGIAINAFFEALSEVISYMGSSSMMSSLSSSAQSTTKSWDTVILMSIYGVIGLSLAFCLYKNCDLLALGERNAKSLGMNVNAQRIIISVVAVLLAIIPTVQVGMISFVGLVVPHLGRLLVGSGHKCLIPFTALLGGALLLLADFLGRTIIYPFEIPIGVMMAVIGAPFFLYMLKRSE